MTRTKYVGETAVVEKLDRVNALVIAHDAKATGGVNNFLRVMRVCYRDRVSAYRMPNGPRAGENKSRTNIIKRMVRDYFNFVSLIVRKKFQVIHINPSLDQSSTPRELLLVYLAAIFSPRTKRLIFYRGWVWEDFRQITASPTKRLGLKGAHSLAHRILVLSPAFKQALIQSNVPAEKIEVVTTMFEGDPLARACSEVTTKRPYILFLARFIPAKGGKNLIKAFASVRENSEGWTLVMAGDGPERAELEELAASICPADSVVFPGYVGGSKKMHLLAQSAIFVLPSTHSEGLPNAILEAMAAGAAIVTTAVGGIDQVVADGANGTILSDTEPASIAAGLQRYTTDRELLEATSRNNREIAWSKWESKIVSNKIADIYYEMNRT